jgi:hypothetical protein
MADLLHVAARLRALEGSQAVNRRRRMIPHQLRDNSLRTLVKVEFGLGVTIGADRDPTEQGILNRTGFAGGCFV